MGMGLDITTKICSGKTGCGLKLPMTSFSTRSDGRMQSLCRECHNSYMRKHYKKNSKRYKQLSRERESIYKRDRYDWLREYFQSHPCIDCGESDPIVLEFDHRDPDTKLECVSVMIAQMHSMEKIEKEIAKCDVRCANCHRRRTATQQNHYWVNPKPILPPSPKRRYHKNSVHSPSDIVSPDLPIRD